MNTVEESKWKELKGQYVENEGWFVPTLLIKYSQTNTSKTRLLKELCSKWLFREFNLEGKIEDVEVLRQEDIDKALDMICVRFTFKRDGTEGDSVAFLDAAEVKGLV